MGKEAPCTPEHPCNRSDCTECLIRNTRARFSAPMEVVGFYLPEDDLDGLTVTAHIRPNLTESQRELARITLVTLAQIFNNVGALTRFSHLEVDVRGRKRQ